MHFSHPELACGHCGWRPCLLDLLLLISHSHVSMTGVGVAGRRILWIVITWWRSWNWRWAALAAVVGFAMVAVYLFVMVSEGNNSFIEVAPWVLAMLVPAILSLMAWTTEFDRRARAMLLGAAALYLAIGVLSIFTLGIGFLVAGFMALFAANELPGSNRQQLIR